MPPQRRFILSGSREMFWLASLTLASVTPPSKAAIRRMDEPAMVVGLAVVKASPEGWSKTALPKMTGRRSIVA